MKQYLALAIVLAFAIAAIVSVQYKHIDTQPSPQALLTAAADAQHEVTRLPTRLDRMSAADKIAIGDAMARRIDGRPGGDNGRSAHDAAVQAYLQQVGSRVASHAAASCRTRFTTPPRPAS